MTGQVAVRRDIPPGGHRIGQQQLGRHMPGDEECDHNEHARVDQRIERERPAPATLRPVARASQHGGEQGQPPAPLTDPGREPPLRRQTHGIDGDGIPAMGRGAHRRHADDRDVMPPRPALATHFQRDLDRCTRRDDNLKRLRLDAGLLRDVQRELNRDRFRQMRRQATLALCI